MAIKKRVAHSQISLSPVFAIPDGLQVIPVPILLYQKSTGMLWSNPSYEREFGIANLEQFKATPALGFIHERPVSLQTLSMIGRHEGFVMTNLDGSKIPVELKVSAYGKVSDTPAPLSQDLYLVMIEDVTPKVELEKQVIQHHFEIQKAYEQLKQTQAALVQTAKLASLGELSSGIAHELNQPLQAIMGFSQELEYLEVLSPTGKEFVTDIISASKKMAEIIRSLRSFAREAGEDLVETSIEHAIREASHLMHHQLMQKGITLEIKECPDLPMVLANPIQLEQVFINLFSNARDAIETAHPGSGTITVTLGFDQEHITVFVKDDGCGMSEATRDKIFDPFFTTKEVGKGTGLGLSITYGILKKLGAETEVKSALNQGTEFCIKFKHNEKLITKGVAS